MDPERANIGPEALLVDYIRDHALLKGTKFMCREGGCGVCVVSVKTRNVHSGQESIRSINSVQLKYTHFKYFYFVDLMHIHWNTGQKARKGQKASNGFFSLAFCPVSHSV